MTEQNFRAAFERVRKLVADFRQHEAHYLSPKYQEQDVRRDFIDKLWVALGWDVYREQQTNPYEQEVKVERNVNVKGRTKKADYAFLAANFRDVRFFVEAKKPARDIDNPDDYFQTVRYGWNAQTPLSVLTDFEEFRVLDCRYKPDVATALQRAVKKFHYTEYADAGKFAELYHLFSREAVLGGSLEKFAAGLPKPSGRAATQRGLYATGHKGVDEDFLRELDELRGELARSFKNRNPRLNGEELTEATQRVIDRLVFMRFLEDKLIEPEVMVERLGENGSAWADFVAQSQRLNRIYNGIIFRHHRIIDDPAFVADERVFASARERLAHTNSPYDFNSLPVHILGSIYERFLGKVITTTDKRARVEDKPEVRKAGGVYYTPEYVVRYIVAETVGKLIAGKTSEQVAEMRFADIACGSGSFLLGVYDELLRHHAAYYNEPENRRKALRAGCVEAEGGALRLSLRQRKNILLNNIYGVDLDAQAVEVAQLSLFLKLLEDETTASAAGHQMEFRETMLPSLDKNIVHGNSLIGWDIGGGLFGDGEERKLYPMDFEQTFPEVMRRGGFDAIVGNPPYGMVENQKTKDYLSKRFETVEGRFDHYELFIERATKLCKAKGLIGYIVPSPLLSNLYTRKLRRYLLDKFSIREISNFGMDVFADPTVHTCIVVVENSEPSSKSVHVRRQITAVDELYADYDYAVPQNRLGENPNSTLDIFIDPVSYKLLEKMGGRGVRLGDVCFIRQCIKTGDDQSYVTVSEDQPGPEWKPTLRGKSINRYATNESNLWLRYGPWLARNWQNKSFYEVPKLAVRETGSRVVATIDLEHRYFLSSLYAIYPKEQYRNLSLLYLLGVINSQLSTYFLKKVALELTKGAFTKFRTNQLARLPIRLEISFDKADRARHDRMVSLVEQMLAAKRQLQQALTDRDRNHYESKCAALDRQIDNLVYELYELTPEEVTVVEGRDG